ncbi:MAG: hypothetical protein NC390_00315 [Fusobacterium sp.]|nr:hypothetical protein [Fusobacterium sp.]
MVVLLLFLMLFVPLCANAEEPETPLALQLVTPQNIDFSKCVQTFNFPVEKLFYMSILSLNANRFEIEELQSKMGYILFKAAGKPFLMSVIKVDAEHSMLKITPADNVYHFPYGVVYNIYKYIELNADEQLQALSTEPVPQQ